MKTKSYINCYTISINENKAILNPGITTEVFENNFTCSTLKLPETPICRFAVEEKFKSEDPSFEKCWVVEANESNSYFYRFFKRKPAEADQFIFLLLNYNYPEEMSRYLIDHAILLEPKRALVQLSRTSDQYFIFKNKDIFVTPEEIHIR